MTSSLTDIMKRNENALKHDKEKLKNKITVINKTKNMPEETTHTNAATSINEKALWQKKQHNNAPNQEQEID